MLWYPYYMLIKTNKKKHLSHLKIQLVQYYSNK
uniref:Uncharacterized protein n=1 Tax=Anguilla anguilla TaxID=7936 RepID=A0A0E9W5I3_ANGAN